MSSFDLSPATEWQGRPVARRLADARPRSRMVVTGVVVGAHPVKEYGGCSYVVRLEDGTAGADLLFVGRDEVPGLVPGITMTVEGVPALVGGELVVWNPLYRIEAPPAPNA